MRVSPLLLRLRTELAAAGDPGRADGARAYMKTSTPFHGVDAKTFRAICRRVFAEHPIPDAASWRRDVLAVWRGARFREEKYAAIELALHRRAKPFQDVDALPMNEEMIVSGAWWDLVDMVAQKGVGEILARHPKEMKKTMRAWSKGADMWKRRTAILSQNRFGKDTDLQLLFDCIEPSIDSKEFFLRKGIGWALRQLAWWNPKEAVRFVKANEKRLSGLSRREALKNVG